MLLIIKRLTQEGKEIAFANRTLYIICEYEYIYIPIQRGNIFVAGYFSSTLLNAMPQHQLIGGCSWIVWHVPYSEIKGFQNHVSRLWFLNWNKTVVPGENIIKLYLAVLSPDPLAKRSVLGFQAHMNTSDSCPLSTVALLAGISIDWSMSIVSGALGVAAPPGAAVAAHVVPWNKWCCS